MKHLGLLLGLIFTAFVTALLIYLWVRPAEVPRQFEWVSPPSVQFCMGSPVSMERLQRAMWWWESRGTTFRGLYIDPCLQGSNGQPLDRVGKPVYGVIRVLPRDQHFNDAHAGETRWIKSGSIPLWANIYLPSDLPKESLVLEHELGHALGWGHLGQRGHLMNPYVLYMGPDDEGLR